MATIREKIKNGSTEDLYELFCKINGEVDNGISIKDLLHKYVGIDFCKDVCPYDRQCATSRTLFGCDSEKTNKEAFELLLDTELQTTL